MSSREELLKANDAAIAASADLYRSAGRLMVEFHTLEITIKNILDSMRMLSANPDICCKITAQFRNTYSRLLVELENVSIKSEYSANQLRTHALNLSAISDDILFALKAEETLP